MPFAAEKGTRERPAGKDKHAALKEGTVGTEGREEVEGGRHPQARGATPGLKNTADTKQDPDRREKERGEKTQIARLSASLPSLRS